MSTTESEEAFVRELEALLSGGEEASRMDAALGRILTEFDCVLGTIHVVDSGSHSTGAEGLLRLTAQRGLPPTVAEKVQTVPVGKGMAGIAAARMEAVQVCNLQTDESGVARPGARETAMEGCVSAPMIVEGELRGVLGVAKPHAYEFTAAETDLLLRVGAVIGKTVLK